MDGRRRARRRPAHPELPNEGDLGVPRACRDSSGSRVVRRVRQRIDPLAAAVAGRLKRSQRRGPRRDRLRVSKAIVHPRPFDHGRSREHDVLGAALDEPRDAAANHRAIEVARWKALPQRRRNGRLRHVVAVRRLSPLCRASSPRIQNSPRISLGAKKNAASALNVNSLRPSLPETPSRRARPTLSTLPPLAAEATVHAGRLLLGTAGPRCRVPPVFEHLPIVRPSYAACDVTPR
jgi:hypothetical protein